MDLLEYQARALFESYGVPVLAGAVARTPDEAVDVYRKLGSELVVVKAQVRIGGRGKAGGVKLARSEAEVRQNAEAILGLDIKGHVVKAVMLSPGADIAEEYYFSILLDRAGGNYLAMCSVEGGVEIEKLAAERPEALAKVPLDPTVGIDEKVALEIAKQAGFAADVQPKVAKVFQVLWRAFYDSDATLVEVNPMVQTAQGDILALDGKVTLDGNADFRHADWEQYREESGEVDLERQAREYGLNYVKLDGSIGVIGNGAGLVMSTLDVVARAGLQEPGQPKPANFLDIGGGASAEIMANGLRVIMSDPQVTAILVNVFGGITACDDVANGVVQALAQLGDAATLPIVVRLDGNAVAEGLQILQEANHPLVTVETTMDGAAAAVAKLASERK